MRLSKHCNLVDPAVLVMAGLLHDAAKAEEYVINPDGASTGWTKKGSLIGHRLMVFGWIEAAVAAYRIDIPPGQLLALEHAIMATEGIAAWTGFPDQRMLGAKIIAEADRISGSIDIFEQSSPKNVGYGKKHWTMKYAPYFSDIAKGKGEERDEN